MDQVNNEPDLQHCDVVVVGAGFAGLYMLHRLRALGMTVQVLEAGDDIGGTWYWNRYPGARCDIESLEYSYSFDDALQQQWQWSERYATQPEILRYINHVADRFDWRRHVRFDSRVVDAVFDDDVNSWTVTTEHGDQVRARFCIMATGCLSTARVPEIAGLDDFQGRWYHTGFWPKTPVDFTGLRVGVIGTGSSGIQMMPLVAAQASRLSVFQRTANYSLPARNTTYDDAHVQRVKQDYAALRQRAREAHAGIAGFQVAEESALEVPPERRALLFEERWAAGGIGFTRVFNDTLLNADANHAAADFVRGKIRGLVRDPALAEALSPRYFIGTKRLCADSGYFETFNRDNVELVDIKRAPIVEITPEGLRTTEASYALDAIVFATGFDAMTGSLLAMNIHVEGGTRLSDVWAHGPVTYLGLMTAGLPNLFMITGPGSPSVLSNVLVSIEQHVEWIAECLAHLRERGIGRIEADAAAQADWVAHVNAVADKTLMPQGASWYVGANIAGKPRVFMPYVGGVGVYRKKCRQVADDGYVGFRLS